MSCDASTENHKSLACILAAPLQKRTVESNHKKIILESRYYFFFLFFKIARTTYNTNMRDKKDELFSFWIKETRKA